MNELDNTEQILTGGNKFKTEVLNTLGYSIKDKTILVIRDYQIAKYYARYNRVVYLTDNKKLYDKFKYEINNDIYGNNDVCVLINKWKNKLNFNITKLMEKFNMPKFDVAIMNPPYDKNLHLKILEKVKQYTPEIVNISPIRWLEDPCSKYNKRSDYNTFENTVSKYISNLDIVEMNRASTVFNTSFTVDLGIYYLTENGGFDYSSVWKLTTNEKDFNNVKLYWNFPKIEEYSDKGIFIPIKKIVNPDRTTRFNICSQEAKYFINGINPDGKIMKDTLYKSKSMSSDRTYTGIYVKTITEAKNFYESTFTTAYKYAVSLIKKDANVKIDYLPYLSNVKNPRTGKIGYESSWTNEDFCKIFKFDGYINNNEGEPGSDWERILKYMESYK